MPKYKSPEDFFKRARENGSENSKDIVTGEEVKKKLQPCTLKRYARMMEIWKQWHIEHPDTTPYNIKTLQEFTTDVAYGIEGAYGDPVACMNTVVTYLKDFSGGLKQAGHPGLDKELTGSTRNFIQGPLLEKLKMARRKRERRYGTMVHFIHLGTQLWKYDWHAYSRPGIRLDLWGEIQANVFSSARVGEYIESVCRPDTGRGLYYRDVTFGLFRNEHGDAEFAIQLERDAKNMTNTPHKRPQHSLHEALVPTSPPLFWNPILIYLAIFISKGACRRFKTIEALLDLEPPTGNEMYEVEWDPSILDEPFFQRGSGDIDTASVYSRRLRDLGFRANYIVPPTNHDFRAEGIHIIDKLYSSTQRMKHSGHTSEATHHDHYAPNDAGTDGQSAYFGAPVRSLPSDLFRGLTVSRNPELWQSLPAEKQHELENSLEFKTLENQLETLSLSGKDDLGTKIRRRELYAQKRKLVTEELRKCQKLQPKGLPSKSDESDPIGHHRTLFSRARSLMPERDRLAHSMFVAAPIRSDIGRQALRDLITLYRQDSEVAVRPGLEPEKCFCPMIKYKQKVDSKPASQRWRHIYSCYKKRLIASCSFAELCFFCGKWFLGKEAWENHCQSHLDNHIPLPVQCNPFTYGGTLALPGLCPFHLGNTTLPATERMKQFPDPTTWRIHLSNCSVTGEKQTPGDSNSLRCPYLSISHLSLPQCKDDFKSSQDVNFHLQNVHCAQFAKAKRSKPADEAATKFREYKRARSLAKCETDIKGCVTREYEFIDQTAEQWNQARYKMPNISSFTPSTTRSKSPLTAPSTPPSTPPFVDSRSSTPLTEWVQPACEGIAENIDPSLLSQSIIGDGMTRPLLFHSSVIGLGKSSSEDRIDLSQEGPQALEAKNPSDIATACVHLTNVLIGKDITTEQVGYNCLNKDLVIIGDLSGLRATFDSEQTTSLSREPTAKFQASGDPLLYLSSSSTSHLPATTDSVEDTCARTGPTGPGGMEGTLVQPLCGNQSVRDQPVAIDAKRGIWEVEALLAKWKQGKATWYLVKWRGFSHEENTWEKRKGISTELVKEFEATYQGNHLGVRLLDKRARGEKVEYFVEWKGRPESENSWEKEATISSERIMDFEMNSIREPSHFI